MPANLRNESGRVSSCDDLQPCYQPRNHLAQACKTGERRCHTIEASVYVRFLQIEHELSLFPENKKQPCRLTSGLLLFSILQDILAWTFSVFNSIKNSNCAFWNFWSYWSAPIWNKRFIYSCILMFAFNTIVSVHFILSPGREKKDWFKIKKAAWCSININWRLSVIRNKAKFICCKKHCFFSFISEKYAMHYILI